MKRQSTSKFRFAFPLLLAAVSILSYVWFFYLVKSTSEKSSALRDSIELANRKETRILSTKNILITTEKERAKLDNYFIEESSVVSFIERLESLGRLSGAKITLTSVDTDKKRKNVLRVDLKASGKFENVYYLLSLIEALPFEINVNRFVMGKGTEPAGRRTGWNRPPGRSGDV